MATMPPLELISTPDLCEGDIVWVYGMRVQLSERRERLMPGADSPVVWFHGLVLNAADLPDNGVASKGYRTDSRCATCEPGQHWRVQGNALARWAREAR